MTQQSKYSPPSRNPAQNDSLTGLLQLVLAKFLQNTDDMLPAEVIAYDAASNTAQVQPIIDMVTTSAQAIPRSQIPSVPVMQLSGGGFLLRFPLNPGDLGWIKANDRDISLFKQSFTESVPNTQRKHTFEDGLFIPQAAWNLVSVSGEDTGNMVIQNYAGTVKISLSNDTVTITAPNMIVNGITTINGNTTINGELTVTEEITGNSIALTTHVHSGVQAGGSDTGPPV